MELTFDVEIDLAVLDKRFENMNQDAETMLAIYNLLALYCDPYVPFREGPLSQTFEVTPDYLKYIVPYAHYQYHGVGFNHTLTVHPLATAEWDKAMMRDRGEDFENAVKQIITMRYNELYG